MKVQLSTRNTEAGESDVLIAMNEPHLVDEATAPERCSPFFNQSLLYI